MTGTTRGGREGALGVSEGGRFVGVALLLERELCPVGERLNNNRSMRMQNASKHDQKSKLNIYPIVLNNEERPPIWPTPPKSCISCCCDMLFNMFCSSPSGAPPLLLRLPPTVGGLFSTSLIRRQYSSSLSVLGSFKKIFEK